MLFGQVLKQMSTMQGLLLATVAAQEADSGYRTAGLHFAPALHVLLSQTGHYSSGIFLFFADDA
jgi:hypothetical protein